MGTYGSPELPVPESTPPPPGVISPDGMWRWDGAQWVATGAPPPPPPAYPAMYPQPQPRHSPFMSGFAGCGGAFVFFLILIAISFAACAGIANHATDTNNSTSSSMVTIAAGE